MSANIDIEAVKAATDLTRIIRETVVLHKNGHYLVGLCPFHAEKTPSFLAFPDHFHCFGCGKHGDAIDWLTLGRAMSFGEAVDHLAVGGSGTVMEGKKPKREAEGDDKRNVDLARRIWGECTTATCTIVEDYLRSRGLTLPPMAFRFLRHCGANGTVLRFHPQCPRGKKEREAAMVALMTDPETQEPRGIHRTFLRPDGSGHTGRIARPCRHHSPVRASDRRYRPCRRHRDRSCRRATDRLGPGVGRQHRGRDRAFPAAGHAHPQHLRGSR